MTIIELTDHKGKMVYVVCEHISAIHQRVKGSTLISGGHIIVEVRETPREIIELIQDAMS